MKKITLLIGLAFLLSTIGVTAQNLNTGFGLKAGANYAKFTSTTRMGGVDFPGYRRKPGFYIGGFLNIEISEKVQFQPELLFALQGTTILIEGIQIQDTNGKVTIADFRSNINELTISAPIVFRYFFTDNFFVDGGPQLGYIFDRNEKIKENPFEQSGNPREGREFDYDNFDAGLTIGTGYQLTKNFGVNGRFFFGLIERDNVAKSSVFNLGIEYQL